MMLNNFWSGIPVLVTGATGIVGSWLCSELLHRGAAVVALVKDSDPRSELFRTGDINQVTVVNGNLHDYWTVESAINEHDIQIVFHLALKLLLVQLFVRLCPRLKPILEGHTTFLRRAECMMT